MEPRLTFDLAEFDFDTIQRWLASTYWSPGISRERVERGFRRSSLCVACFVGERQVGVARCLTDTTRFAYFSDVFVDPDHRGQGVARRMVTALLDHADVRDADCCYLLTADAHGVYAPLGFSVPKESGKLMLRAKPGTVTCFGRID